MICINRAILFSFGLLYKCRLSDFMASSIQTVESSNNSSFGKVTFKKNPNKYWLSTSGVDAIEISDKKREKQDKIEPKIKIITPDEARQTNNTKLIGISIASVTVLTAAGLFFLLKGGTKGLSKNFQRLRDFFDRKAQSSKLENSGEISPLNRAYIYMVKGLDYFLRKFEAVNNFATIKDLAFKELMFNRITGKYTGPVHDAITRMFEKIGRQSVVNCYKDTLSRMKTTSALAGEAAESVMRGNSFEVVEINGVKKTKAQWLAQVNEMNLQLKENYDKYFSEQPLQIRYYKFKKSVEGLKSIFSNWKVFWSKDLWRTFLAESAVVKEKTAIQKVVHENRLELSYSMLDMAKDSDEAIMKMTELISYKDVEKIGRLRNIRANIKKYAKHPEDLQLKDKILKDIDSLSDKIWKSVQDKNMDISIANELLLNIADLKNKLLYFKQGQVEDILDIYKRLLPADEYKNIEKAYKGTIKSLDKSIRIETEEFVSKLRDLVLGSAPTDILTILGSLGVLGYQLGKSDDKEQRMSISLKYGIPAVAGIGISLYCNAKLYAGTKSLVIGTISSLVVNKIGVWADNMLKKYRENQKSQANINDQQEKIILSPAGSLLQNPPKTV